MKRLSWPQMQEYWRIHSSRWAGIDYGRDPDGLTNVCHPGAPLWFNRHFDRIQRAAFFRLLSLVPAPGANARGLDIGCGAGRWARILAAKGYSTVGIDLQPELIKADQARHPEVEFKCVSIQDFEDEAGFDIVSSVTVLQHNPHVEQETVVSKLRRLLRPGGYAIVLEETGEEAPGVFSRTAAGWRDLFERSGFRCPAVRPCNFSPFIRLHWRVACAVRNLCGGVRPEETPETYLVPADAVGGGRALLRALNTAARWVAVRLDAIAEPMLASVSGTGEGPVKAAQCAFLLKAF